MQVRIKDLPAAVARHRHPADGSPAHDHPLTANKPLHELRKEIGALVATEHGIYAASRFLRHSDITTTARHYADHKGRISVGLGKLLNTEITAAEATASAL